MTGGSNTRLRADAASWPSRNSNATAPERAGAETPYSTKQREYTKLLPTAPFVGRTLFSMPLKAMLWELLVPIGWSDQAQIRAAAAQPIRH